MSLRWQRQIGEIRGLIKQVGRSSRVQGHPGKIAVETVSRLSRFVTIMTIIIIVVWSSCLIPQTRCRCVSVHVIDVRQQRVGHLGLRGAAVNKHPFTTTSNKWGRNSICQHSLKTIPSRGLADIHHQEKPMWWNPQTGSWLTANALPRDRSIQGASAHHWL